MTIARLSLLAALAALLLVAISCGGKGSRAGSNDRLTGIWRGQQLAGNAGAPSGALCLLVAQPDASATPVPPGAAVAEHFEGAVYLGSDLLGPISGDSSPDGAFTIVTLKYTYTGNLVGKSASGTWSASVGGTPEPQAGTWTLVRTKDTSCAVPTEGRPTP